MPRVVVAGAGVAGCAAALAASKLGVEVVLLEKTDMVGGLALVSGRIGGDGSLAARAEAKAMGAGEMFLVIESLVLNRIEKLEIQRRNNVFTFDVLSLEGKLRALLKNAKVILRTLSRVTGVKLKKTRLGAVLLEDGSVLQADSFVDATGSAGTVAQCRKYGTGCVMCILRCPTFGGRVSLSAKAGVKELAATRPDGTPGAVSSGFLLEKGSLSPALVKQLNKEGYIVIPLPERMVRYEKLSRITATHNAQRELIENLVIFNVGFAKVVVQSSFPLDELRSLPGFENARYADPLSGGRGNAIRSLAMVPRDDALKVRGLDNLFAAGEKAGPIAGLTDVIVTGILAGHNAARRALRKEELVLPRTTAIGDFIAYTGERLNTQGGLASRYGFSGGVYLEQMKQKGLYAQDEETVHKRIARLGLTGLLAG